MVSMHSIRRLYFFLVALISLEIVIWGLINLLRTIVARDSIFPGVDTLAQALALIVVGVPIFLLHWLWAQRAAARDDEEHTATLRAVFLYGVVLATLIPVVQDVLAFIDRTLISSSGMEATRAILGAQQTWQDNLIAIALNGVAAAYFYTVLRANWQALKERANFGDVRRLYRYIWMLYGLSMTLFGVQQVLSFLFYIPSTIIAESGRELVINGLALVILGAPIWSYAWTVCQKAMAEPAEQGSQFRLVVLYILALAGVVTVLTCAGLVLDTVLLQVLGENRTLQDFLQQIGNPLSIGIPLAGIWAYYGTWLGKEFDSVSDVSRRGGLKRFYFYILSLIGLVATFIGLALLLSFVVDVLSSGFMTVWGETLRSRVAGAIAILFAGLPLWLLTWRPMQAEALAQGDAGDWARSSLVRRFYLYLIIFASVIGGMVSGVYLVYQALNALLHGNLANDFLSTLLNTLQVLVLFVAFLLYHLSVLRRDGSQAADTLVARRGRFAMLVLERKETGFAAPIQVAIQRSVPGIPLAVWVVEQGLPPEAANAQAIVLSSALALDPPEALRVWLKEYSGPKIIVPVEDKNWLWPGGLARKAGASAAQIVRQLADGQEVRVSSGTAAWQVVAYVFAGLFALELALILFAIVMSIFIH
jgi:hypothetical protein